MTMIDRRSLLQSSALAAALSALGTAGRAEVPAGRDPFEYEITRTDAEWREMLDEESYAILREGKTEPQRTSDLWFEERPGSYNCKGCGLEHYTHRTKVVLSKGWVFFTASEPNSQLMSQDGRAEMSDPSPFDIFIEVHCRRCGSHTGHILLVENNLLHCINGTALDFVEAAA